MSLKKKPPAPPLPRAYSGLVGGISELLEIARRASARTVNSFMTATYWEVGRRIVEFEQAGKKRAEYGEALLTRLADDLTRRFGRGFSRFNLGRFRQFYLANPVDQIRATLSLKSSTILKRATTSLESDMLSVRPAGSRESVATPLALADLARAFPLPWSHYVLLILGGRPHPPA